MQSKKNDAANWNHHDKSTVEYVECIPIDWYETLQGSTTQARQQRTAIRSEQEAQVEHVHLAELQEIIVKIYQGNNGALVATAQTGNSNRLHSRAQGRVRPNS